MTNNAVLNLAQWAISQLFILDSLPSRDTWEEDLWVDLAYLVKQCGESLNGADIDDWELAEDAEDIASRMESVDGSCQFQKLMDNLRGT
ncbi:hypothetical protein [Klebsiella aerogenes]|uniref:hypothetical protein n=1 Tax=Klebsiella aerogenes TaxID=548 RepID=UPI00075C6016|nr:hypothetical protein [Klebsiella aerogenes]EKZ5441424.1 hypothetical protein [Klebsiella aerogenes]KVI80516.1 hypothetical protein AWS46_16840 [Klebsiella aerogenes]KVI80661.1 hypothetical protein AWS47_17925 [Klebsiella aerogenes]HBS5779069.1 hypothetical protein [Klebsiella aerogenes]